MAFDPDETKSVVDDEAGRTRLGLKPRLHFAFCTDQLSSEGPSIELEAAEVSFGRSTGGFVLRADGSEVQVGLPDGRVSGRHARIVRSGASFSLEDLGSKNGTVLNGHRVVRSAPLVDGDVLELGHTFFVYRDRTPSGPGPGLGPWRLSSTALSTSYGPFGSRLFASERVAPTDVPIMIRGESGVGKEVAAQALHSASGRRGQFIGINCGALPENLLESELFGAERGAFSGADRARTGLIRAAHGGTLFLDEIGELPLAAQVKLLRALQERTVVPLGGTTPVPVDFRLITATHRDLEAKVVSQAFRGDLLARIEGFTLEIPPLRARREDIGALLRTFIGRDAEDVVLSRSAARALMLHEWPFNVRQLEKVIRLGVTLRTGNTLTLEHLELSSASVASSSTTKDISGSTSEPSILDRTPDRALDRSEPQQISLPADDEARRAVLVELLQTYEGNVTRVAEVTGKARMQIHRWMKRYQIDRTRPQ